MLRGRCANARERVVEGVRHLVQVARLEPALDTARVDLHAEDRRAGHRRRERLRAAHPAEARSEDRPATEVWRAEVLLARRSERLVRALEDSLGADVDPATGCHLAEHREPQRLEPSELVPRGPARNEQGVRDEDAGRRLGRAEHGHRLAALHEKGLVGPQAEKRSDDLFQRSVASRGTSGSAVDDESLGMLGDLGVEIVEQHPQRCLRLPAQCVQRGASRCADRTQIAAECIDRRVGHGELGHASAPTSDSAASTIVPERIASATTSMSALSDRSSVKPCGHRPHDVVDGAHTAARLQRREELDRLRPGEELDRERVLGVVEDAKGLQSGRVPHRDVILLARARRDRVDAGRMGEHLVLGDECRSDVLRDHEARVEAAFLDEEGRKTLRQ